LTIIRKKTALLITLKELIFVVTKLIWVD